MDQELFKLLTRRYIAWPLMGVALLSAGFLVVYGALSRQTELVTLGAGALFAELGTVIGFYFGTKDS